MNSETPQRLRELACEAVRRLQSAGFTAYWAGGSVRDVLMNRSPKDYDIATDATPDQVTAVFSDAVLTGKSFGVVRVPVEESMFEVATFRKDHSYRDGRRPEEVSFTDAETDARRRDFTINAIFYDPIAKEYHDYTGGQKDIESRLVRCVGDAAERIREDHLRMLRAVRFASTFGFSLHAETAAAIRANAGLISKISAERIRDELTRTLIEARRPGDALMMMDDLGLLGAILPEIMAMKGQIQPPQFHPEGDVFTHTVLMLNAMISPSQNLAWSVLLHDVGKPLTAEQSDERIRFDGHAEEGAEAAGAILLRLRFSNDDIETITHCIRGHMRLMNVRNMRRSTLRRLVGAPTFAIELELHRLDCQASHGDLSNYHHLVAFQKEMAAEPVLPPPVVSGHDIMALGVPEGPDVGLWRKKAYDAQLEGRLKTREELLEWLKGEIRGSGK